MGKGQSKAKASLVRSSSTCSRIAIEEEPFLGANTTVAVNVGAQKVAAETSNESTSKKTKGDDQNEISPSAPVWLIGPGGVHANPLGGLVGIIALCVLLWRQLTALARAARP